MKNKIIIAAILAAISTTGIAGGSNGNNGEGNQCQGNSCGGAGGSGGSGGNGYAAAGAAAGAVAGAKAGANASASNLNLIGVGVKNSSRIGVNSSNSADFNNTNLIGGSSQSLSNVNDLRNSNYMEGQRQGQDQLQGQGQKQTQGNQQVMQYNESEGVHYSGSYKIRNVPSMALGGIDPTAPCAIPIEGTYSGVGIGLGLGTAYVDKGCEVRELVRLGLQSGVSSSMDKATRLLNNELDKALESSGANEIEDRVASGGVSTTNEGVFALTDY